MPSFGFDGTRVKGWLTGKPLSVTLKIGLDYLNKLVLVEGCCRPQGKDPEPEPCFL